MTRTSGLGISAKGSVAPVLASGSASSLSGSPVWLGTHWKLRATQEERELGVLKYLRRTLAGKTLGGRLGVGYKS